MVNVLVLYILSTAPVDGRAAAHLHCARADGSECRRANVQRPLRIAFTYETTIDGSMRLFAALNGRTNDDGIDAVVEYAVNADGSLHEIRCHELAVANALDGLRPGGVFQYRSLCDGRLLAASHQLAKNAVPNNATATLETHKPAMPARDMDSWELGISHVLREPNGNYTVVALQLGRAPSLRPAVVLFNFNQTGNLVSSRCVDRLPTDGQKLTELRISPVRVENQTLTFSNRCSESLKQRDLVLFRVDAAGALRITGTATERL